MVDYTICYITHISKEQFGVCIIKYLPSIRITKAKNLLPYSNKSAKEMGVAYKFSIKKYKVQ